MWEGRVGVSKREVFNREVDEREERMYADVRND